MPDRSNPARTGGAYLAAGAFVALVDAGYGLLAGFSIWSTDASTYRHWVAQGFRWGGAAGLAVSAIGASLWFLYRRREPRFARGTAWTVGAVVAVITVGAAISAGARRHPMPTERRVAAAFPLPESWGPGTFRVAGVSRDTFTGATVDPPTMDRVIDTPLGAVEVCAQVGTSLASWAGAQRGSGNLAVYTTQMSRTGIACYVSARSPDGWPVYVFVAVRPDKPFAGRGGVTLGQEDIPPHTTRVVIEVGPAT